MSKSTKEPQESGSSDQKITESEDLQQGIPEGEVPAADNSNNEAEPAQKLTVGQFLKRAPQKSGIDGLIRSLYSLEVMSFEEWKNKIDALLKKRTS